MSTPILVNNRHYPLWQQFVDRAQEWVGGTLEDHDDPWGDQPSPMVTKITGIELRPNGTDSAFFVVQGEEFECGFDVGCGGIQGGEEGWITFSGYGGHKWRIKKP